MRAIGIIIYSCFTITLAAQTFYFGNDLSYVNQMEDCGAVFRENQITKDVYQIFADHGTNLIRMRLWVDPVWQNSLEQPVGVKPQYSDFEDVCETIHRSKQAGMQVMLDMHLSDFWADPGRQVIPARWVDVAYDTAALADSVYNYVFRILTWLDRDTLMPEIVQVGNETNSGILLHATLNPDYSPGETVSNSWERHAHLYNAAIRAIRDASEATLIKPKVSLHYAGLNSISWWYNNIIDNGVTDFDIIGFSYYYAWHGRSIAELGNTIRSLRSSFPDYEVMVLETGYLWTTQNFDGYANIVTTPDPDYMPVCPEKQFEYMFDYTREVMLAGGIGVIFWEPAWVSTPCRTPWGQGSSHDHLVFFDPVHTNFMENGGGRWTEFDFYEHLDYKKMTFKVGTEDIDVPDKMYITGTMTGEPWIIEPMFHEETDLYNYVTYLPQGDSGAFYFLNDSLWAARETVPTECATWWGTDRGYKIGQNDTVISYKWGTCDPIEGGNNVFSTNSTEADIRVYPNPLSGTSLNLELTGLSGISVLKIYDFNGTILLSKCIENTNRITIHVDFKPGIYNLQLENNTRLINRKIIIY